MSTTPTNNFDFQNYYSATLQADITAASLALSLDNVPIPVEGVLVIEPDSANNREIIFYTGKTVSTITLPSDGRGWDGTTATAHLAGSTVIMAPVSYMFRMLKSGSLYDSTKTGWTTLGTAPTYVQHNGQKEFVLSTATDLTGTVGPGTKIKFDRPAGTPTQSMQFVAASSQYAAKASPAGVTFTGDFSIEVWVYMNSYPAVAAGVLSRDSSTSSGSGFEMNIDSIGRISTFFRNAAGASSANTFQSIPMKKWTHIAVSVTAASGNSGFQFYMDGVNVPAQAGTGTAATSVVQSSSPLTLGERVGATAGYFDGQMAQVRLWSSQRTAQQIKDNMATLLTGSETNLVSLFPGNGDFTDKTINANTLVASGGAIATFADNPYKSTEYLIVTNITATQMVLFSGFGAGIPSTGVLSNFFYSNARAPYGFPADKSRWAVKTFYIYGIPIGAAPNWTNIGQLTIAVPTGAFVVKPSVSVQVYNSGAVNPLGLDGALSTNSTTATYTESLRSYLSYGNYHDVVYSVDVPVTNTALTTLYVNFFQKSNATGIGLNADTGYSLITAECAYV